MSEPLELQNFFIDTVKPVEEHEHRSDPDQVQLVRYSVLGTSAEDAFKRFIEDEAGVEVERTEPTNFIVVGINPGSNPFG